MIQAPKRFWLRYCLRTMLVTFTILAVWLGWNVHIVRKRGAFADELRARQNGVHVWTVYGLRDHRFLRSSASVSVLREWLGDEAIGIIRFPAKTPDAKLQAAAKVFPEAVVERWEDMDEIMKAAEERISTERSKQTTPRQ